jgi:hypothetical protein
VGIGKVNVYRGLNPGAGTAIVEPMSSALAPHQSGARRLWDTDPFLLLDWDSPDRRGPGEVDREHAAEHLGIDYIGAGPVGASWETQSDFDWTAMERATWDTDERAVLRNSLAELSSQSSPMSPTLSAPPERNAEHTWASTPEWLRPSWLGDLEPERPSSTYLDYADVPSQAPRYPTRTSSPPDPSGMRAVDLSALDAPVPSAPADSARGDEAAATYPRRRDLRAARADRGIPEASEVFSEIVKAVPDADRLGTSSKDSSEDLDEARAVPRTRREMRLAERERALEPRRKEADGRKSTSLASSALGSAAARVAVLTVLGAVGATLVTGSHPDFLSLGGKGLAESASADMATRTVQPGNTAPGSSSLDTVQRDYQQRATELQTETAVEDRTVTAMKIAKKLSAEREAARVKAARKAAAVERQEAMNRAMRNAQRNPKAVGKVLAADRGWTGSEWQCLDNLWTRESHWNYQASNASSGAYGIPQSLPGSKMASAGSDWKTNPVTQIKWGLGYIADRYGTPCKAWSHSESTGWY